MDMYRTVSILDRDFLFCPSLNSLPLSYKDSMGVPWVTHGIPEIPWKAHGFPMEFAIKFHGIDHNSMEGPWAPHGTSSKGPWNLNSMEFFPKVQWNFQISQFVPWIYKIPWNSSEKFHGSWHEFHGF